METERVVEEEHKVKETVDVPPTGTESEASSIQVEAAQGGVAVAAEAVALAEATTARAQLTAAEAVDNIGRSVEERLGEFEAWRAETGTAILGLAEAMQQYQTEHSSIHETLNGEIAGLGRKFQSQQTKPLSEVVPSEDVVVENPAPRKRHRLI